VLALAAIALAAVAVSATEFYTTRYQSLPVLDWLESRPPLVESANVPAAADLVRGLPRVMPLLLIHDDVRSRLPEFGPPALFQRTIGGVRDAARIELGSPGSFGQNRTPVGARLDVIVFDRALRAKAWSDLMAREMDVRDPEGGLYQTRLSGPDELDGVWVARPDPAGGDATVAGHRGAIGFVLEVTLARDASTPPDDVARITDLNARAEAMARQGAADWTAWLAQQLQTTNA
jgi:hypothetical protein